jgi:ApaG protein
MIQQVTKGIRVSVKTHFEGTRFQNHRLYNTFSYHITIENKSDETVQLLSRHWNIFDSLKSKEIVEGEGVIGKKPVLVPQQKYTYYSHCFISSSVGAMQGYYNMISFSSGESFKVKIPTFQLIVPSSLN